MSPQYSWVWPHPSFWSELHCFKTSLWLLTGHHKCRPIIISVIGYLPTERRGLSSNQLCRYCCTVFFEEQQCWFPTTCITTLLVVVGRRMQMTNANLLFILLHPVPTTLLPAKIHLMTWNISSGGFWLYEVCHGFFLGQNAEIGGWNQGVREFILAQREFQSSWGVNSGRARRAELTGSSAGGTQVAGGHSGDSAYEV